MLCEHRPLRSSTQSHDARTDSNRSPRIERARFVMVMRGEFNSEILNQQSLGQSTVNHTDRVRSYALRNCLNRLHMQHHWRVTISCITAIAIPANTRAHVPASPCLKANDQMRVNAAQSPIQCTNSSSAMSQKRNFRTTISDAC